MDGIVIHEGLPDADQEQPLLVAIDSMLDEARGGDRQAGRCDGDGAHARLGNREAFPAIVTVAVRDDVPGLADTVRLTDPLRDPDAPENVPVVSEL